MDRILHYEIAQTLGEGKNGTAYLAIDSGLQRAVVIKSLEKSTLIADEHWRSAFLQQMELFNRLEYDGIARFYAVEPTDTGWIIAREYVEGRAVAGPVTYGRWLEMALELARTLKVIHDPGLAHGNLTITNLLVDTHGRVRLTDACLGAPSRRLDSDQEAICLAPELAENSTPTAAGDMYTLGALLFYLLAGRMPDQSDQRNSEGFSSNLSETQVPGVARLLIRRLMMPDPKERLGSTEELITTLQGMISLGAEPPVKSPPRKWSLSPRQYLMSAMLVLLLVILWLVITSSPR